jgi:predicted kinase
VSDLSQFRCEVPDLVADERLARRRSASDADPHIAAEMRARFEDWPEAVAIDTGACVDVARAQILHRLQPWRTAPRTPRPRMLPD